jgi:competence protein ComEC
MQKPRDAPRINRFLLPSILFGMVIGANLAFHSSSMRIVYVILSLLGLLVVFFLNDKRNGGAFLLLCLISFLSVSFYPKPSEEKAEYQGFVVEARSNYFIFMSDLKRYYVYEKESAREFGDALSIYGESKPYKEMSFESRFSFKEHLHSKGVDYQLSAYKIEEVYQMPIRLKERERDFLSAFSNDSATYLDALLFDHKDYSSNLIKDASSLGCLYFLSSSGLLLSSFIRIFERILDKRVKEKSLKSISFCLCFLLSPFLFYKIGFWRVFIIKALQLIVLFSKGERAPPQYLSLLSLSGIIVCLVNPYHAVSSSFLIGYGLSFFLLFSRSFLERIKGRNKGLIEKSLMLLFLLPMFASNGGLHLLTPLYSILLLPFSISFSLIGFVSFLTVPFTGPINAFSSFLASYVGAISKFDLSIPLGTFSDLLIFSYYLALLLFVYFSELGFFPYRKVLIGLTCISFLLNVIPLHNLISQQVSFINVGQGDAILIRDGWTSVMIDTGGSLYIDMATEVDIPYFRKNGIYDIDCLIASHGDFDHIGAAPSLKKNFRVKNYVDDAAFFPLDVGNLHFENLNTYGYEEENDSSLVLSLDFMNKKWIFTGDAPSLVEKRIVKDNPNLDCDVLKLGHHGSKTSSCLEFLQALTPEVAIISVGEKNTYGHPNDEVLERLDSLGIPYRRTDLEGSITFSSNILFSSFSF